MRRRPRLDEKHEAIVKALRQCGALVLSLAGVGCDVADLLVYFRGQLYLLEVKTHDRAPTEGQTAWLSAWGGIVVRDEREALRAIGALR